MGREKIRKKNVEGLLELNTAPCVASTHGSAPVNPTTSDLYLWSREVDLGVLNSGVPTGAQVERQSRQLDGVGEQG